MRVPLADTPTRTASMWSSICQWRMTSALRGMHGFHGVRVRYNQVMAAPDDDPAQVVACSLTAAQIRERKASLLPGLAARASRIEATPEGHCLQFAAEPGVLAAITDTIEAERQCCRFLRFDLVVSPNGGPVRLTLSGPTGTAELLAELFRA
jgi:hypothetical protein